MADARYDLLYQEAVRQLEAQQRDLDQLRSRGANIVTAVSVATTFLGGSLIRQHSIHGMGWSAIALFVVALTLSAWVMVSRTHFFVGFSPAIVNDSWLTRKGAASTIEEMQINLALVIQKRTAENEPKLQIRRWALGLAGLALIAEIILWILDLM